MIDYEGIIENLQDEKICVLLERFGATVSDKGDYLVCETICHNEDPEQASRKLYYYKNSHSFYCFTECGSLSIFKFLKHFYDTRGIEYDWYNDIYQVVLSCSAYSAPDHRVEINSYKSNKDAYVPQKNYQNLPEFNPGVLDIFVKKYTPEWLNDHISREAMDKYNILYSISQNKIIIPHYDVNNRLVGIRGRALNKQDIEQFGKYMPVQIENKWYSHPLSLNLYGLNLNKDTIRKTQVCYVFESEKSVLQFESFAMPNSAVAVCGSNFNKYQVALLMKHCAPHEIVLCFDNEEKPNEDKYFNKLYSICKKYTSYCNMSFVYDREQITKPKDSPTDNGEDIFRELVYRRVRV